MNEQQYIKAISRKLRDKWGYSKHQIDVYWESKKDECQELTIEFLKNELEEI